MNLGKNLYEKKKIELRILGYLVLYFERGIRISRIYKKNCYNKLPIIRERFNHYDSKKKKSFKTYKAKYLKFFHRSVIDFTSSFICYLDVYFF